MTAARALAVVLVLAIAAPAAGLADDFAAHDGATGTELAIAAAGGANQAADPGIAAHVHCGCHQTASLDQTVLAPVIETARPRYAPTRQDPTSVIPQRPARPPRA